MPGDIPESDWKVLRSLLEPLRERFCERILKEVVTLAGEPGLNSHQRYLQVFAHLREQDEDLALAFDDPRRSNAVMKIMTLYSRQLLREEEFRRFTQQIQEKVVSICDIKNAFDAEAG